jgi:hypothetical protein
MEIRGREGLIPVFRSGSAPMDYGFEYCLFLQWLSKCQEEAKVFFPEIFLLFGTVGTLTSVLKDNKL